MSALSIVDRPRNARGAFLLAALLATACATVEVPSLREAGGGAVPEPPRADLKVEARRVLLSKPRTVVWNGETLETKVVVEFTVRAPLGIPVESRSPILRVGERLVGYAEYLEPHVLRFTEFQPEKLPEGGLVALQIGYEAAQPLYVSDFVYRASAVEVVER